MGVGLQVRGLVPASYLDVLTILTSPQLRGLSQSLPAHVNRIHYFAQDGLLLILFLHQLVRAFFFFFFTKYLLDSVKLEL